ncbi:MAG: hypothetical protein Salg2KO_04530 [Salibacteraceae bacterium]
MKEFKEDINVVSDNAQNLVRTEIKYAKLQLVKDVSGLSSFMFSRFLLTILSFVTYAILMTGLGIYLNNILESNWLGLILAGLLSLIVVAVTYFGRKFMIEHPFQDYVISQMTKKMNL